MTSLIVVIIVVLLMARFFWYFTFGGGRSSSWECSRGHIHGTRGSAERCSERSFW